MMQKTFAHTLSLQVFLAYSIIGSALIDAIQFCEIATKKLIRSS